MSEYQKGRTTAIHHAGVNVEDIGESYEKDLPKFDVMKQAYVLSTKVIEELQTSFISECKGSKFTVREAELVKFYLGKSVDLLKALHSETESKKQQTIGSIEAIKKAVAVIKRIYDEENSKLVAIEEWQSNESKDIRARPTGAYPGNPLKDMKAKAEEELKAQSDKLNEQSGKNDNQSQEEPKPEQPIAVKKKGRPSKVTSQSTFAKKGIKPKSKKQK